MSEQTLVRSKGTQINMGHLTEFEEILKTRVGTSRFFGLYIIDYYDRRVSPPLR